jgi:hypothetical protein
MEASNIKLRISEDLSGIIEKRGIKIEDIQETIAAGEATGKKLSRVDDENKFLARARIGKYNVYAEYTPDADGFILNTAYAHIIMLVSDDK